jgi:hypothetical protein
MRQPPPPELRGIHLLDAAAYAMVAKPSCGKRMRTTMVYRARDFGMIVKEIKTICDFLTWFNNVAERDQLPPIFGSQQAFQWLVRQPAIRNKLVAQSDPQRDP